MASDQKSESVLLVGSVRLRDVEDVMETAGRILGPYLTRIPDGEVAFEPWGPRRAFAHQFRPIVESNPALEPDPEEVARGERISGEGEQFRSGLPPRYRLKPGVDPVTVRFETTGLADNALKSYAIFKRLKDAGKISAGTRFQACLPTTSAFLNTQIAVASQLEVEPAYRAALFADIDRIVAAVPADELTIQWDVSSEMAQWEGVRPSPFDDVHDALLERLALQCNHVPPGVELGVHLCYGNHKLRHWKEPDSVANMVDVLNGLSERVTRPINYVHMPVPVDRDDDAYYAALDNLRLGAGTQVYLGLVHERDGVDGARRRIAAAKKHCAHFGIATECGFGEREPDVVPGLMELHTEIVDALAP